MPVAQNTGVQQVARAGGCHLCRWPQGQGSPLALMAPGEKTRAQEQPAGPPGVRGAALMRCGSRGGVWLDFRPPSAYSWKVVGSEVRKQNVSDSQPDGNSDF